MKEDTDTITLGQLAKVLHKTADICPDWLNSRKSTDTVLQYIFEVADCISQNPCESMEINDKVVLSIATRLKAEIYIIKKIELNDGNLTRVNQVRNRETSQFGKLLQLYKSIFSDDKDSIRLLDTINLMTSENIHINSFMFEPIIDVSIENLASLYISMGMQLHHNCGEIFEVVEFVKH